MKKNEKNETKVDSEDQKANDKVNEDTEKEKRDEESIN